MKDLRDYILESNNYSDWVKPNKTSLLDVKSTCIGKDCWDSADNQYKIVDVWLKPHTGSLSDAKKSYKAFLDKYDSKSVLRDISYDKMINDEYFKKFDGLVGVEDSDGMPYVFTLDDEDGIRLKK